MITVREAEKKDYKVWTAFLRKAEEGNPWQSIEWINSIQNHPAIHPFLLIAEKDDEIVGGVMGSIGMGKSITRFFKIIKVSHGPIITNNNVGDNLQEGTLRAINEGLLGKARDVGAFLVDVKSPFLWGSDIFAASGFTAERYSTPCSVIFDLTEGEETLFKGMKKSTRRSIRKAEKFGVSIEVVKTREQMSEYYNIYLKKIQRTGANLCYPFSVFESLMEEKNKIAVFFIARYKSKAIAGKGNLLWNNNIWAWDNSSLPEYWHLNSNRLLMWHSLKWSVENKYKNFDLYGLPCKPEGSGKHIDWYIFKTCFGGQIVRKLNYYVSIVSPMRWMLWSKLWKLRSNSALLQRISNYMIR